MKTKKRLGLVTVAAFVTWALLASLFAPAAVAPALADVPVNGDEEPEALHLHSADLIDPLMPPPEWELTNWHELHPDMCNEYQLGEWKDTNEDGNLSPCDHIELEDKETGEKRWYHVEWVTVTILVTPKEIYSIHSVEPDLAEPMYLEFEGGYELIEQAILNPECTRWHEVWPVFSNAYHLTEWIDGVPDGGNGGIDGIGDGKLSYCDLIILSKEGIVLEESGLYHVEEVTEDIVVTPVPPLEVSISATPNPTKVCHDVTFIIGIFGGVGPYTYSWDFSDGETSSEPSPTYHYAEPGTYTATCAVTDSLGNEVIASVDVEVNPALEVSISATPNPTKVDHDVTFIIGIFGGVGPYTYSWDFGDGGTSTDPSPTHPYSASGTYTVTCTVTDSLGNEVSISVDVEVNPPLEVSIAATPNPTQVCQNVTFTVGVLGGVGPYDYSWDFSDGGTSSDPSPTHHYAAPGTYTVTCTVTDSLGNEVSISVDVEVSPPLEVDIDASPNPTKVCHDVTFTSKVLGGVGPYKYSWDFGDGGTGAGPSPTYHYADSGKYKVTCTVTDSSGNSAEDSLNMEVKPALEVDITASPNPTRICLDVTFTSNVLGGVGPYKYSWDFGDGGTSTAASSTHHYADPGSYVVECTVTDSLDNEVILGVIVVVCPDKPPEIEEIVVEGIPDRKNPTTNDPSTFQVEKAKLEAKITSAECFEVTRVSWSGDITPGRLNPYDYIPPAGTHGNKTAVCTITYKDTITGKMGTNTKTKTFKLFFVKKGHEDGAGKPPNWFKYWSKIVTPSLIGTPKPTMVYSASTYWTLGTNKIHLSDGDAGSYNAPCGLNNPLEGIDNFVWSVVHESQHYAWGVDWWGNKPATWNAAKGKTGKNDDKDSDGLPNRVEDLNGNGKFNPPKEKYDWAKYLTPGAPATIINDEEWKNCWDHRGVTGKNYHKKDWANPGKQSNHPPNSPSHSQTQECKELISVLLPTATFNGTYSDYGTDTDGDGLYNYLTIEAGISVTVAGNYKFSGGLGDSDGNVWLTETYTYLDIGGQSVTLDFDGLNIHQSRVNGPYNLVDITLSDDYCGLHDSVSDAHTTSAYNFQQFEREATEFTGTFSDYGTDTDGDGLYDYLTVEVEVNTTTAGNYTIEGWLYDSNGNAIVTASNPTHLDVGNKLVNLNFNGVAINRNRVDGPYYLRYLNLSGSGQIDFIYDAYATSAYNYTDFQRTDGAFTTFYSDYGKDTDGDGLYNYLTVEVGIDVMASGNYTLLGWLYDHSETEIVMATNSGYLEAGSQIMVLDFDGIGIFEHRADGPYDLKYLTLYDENGALMDTLNYAYTTSAYKFTDFQGKLISATIDLDPDTLNLRSKGKWITAYIELPDGYAVNDIDVTTVFLNDVIQAEPKPVEIGDYDSNGISDLMVKFDRDAVQSLLTMGEQVRITISGVVAGVTFEGTDIIRVIGG